ncbi:MAG: SUMF1/EgtB/PvdO family nonheme iron enzyme [Anaerolinea sp.]|nr:SUMF1/EgtB/PvdO family nonheme iron enzyme [Anaerolinea sp.]
MTGIYRSYYSSSPYSNPPGPETGTWKVVRGGGWYDVWGGLRDTTRNDYNPSVKNNSVGFRCVSAPGE